MMNEPPGTPANDSPRHLPHVPAAHPGRASIAALAPAACAPGSDDIYRQLQEELDDARLLHSISAMLVDENSVDQLLQKLVDAATRVMRSDFGSIQRFDEQRDALQLISTQGLGDEALAYFEWVHRGRGTTCGKALQLGERVVVADFEQCDFLAGSEDLVAFRRAGVRAAQSTPLLTRNGRLVGMITTHWTRVCVPRERDLRILDIVARQAADLIERNMSAEALRQQTARLLEADRRKDEFIATLAHELRNPLAPIRNGVTLLKLGSGEQAPRVLSMMERQLTHMVRLVDDLLDASRIGRGVMTLKRERVQLQAVIDSAIETSRPAIDAGGHAFTVSVNCGERWLVADTTRLAQIISNLLNNAAKYTPAGGAIDLTAHAGADAIVIAIRDSGIGIAADMLERIFELFAQVETAHNSSHGGLGVGLALSQHLAQLHGGHIDVNSDGVGHGSLFRLHLPLAGT